MAGTSGQQQQPKKQQPEPKKQQPAQRTLAYEYYLIKQIREKTPMNIKLVNGEIVSGIITWYDQYAIKLEREPAEPNLVIQKQAILYYYKKED
ncbi:MAG: Hfq-like protein [Candidatus Poribacteria bacterium]